MKRTQIIAAVMTLTLLLGQVAAVVHFCTVPHCITPDGHSVRASSQTHGESDDEEASSSGHHHNSGHHHHKDECFALKWLTAPQTDVFHPAVFVFLHSESRIVVSIVRESEAVSSIDVLFVSPSQSPPVRA